MLPFLFLDFVRDLSPDILIPYILQSPGLHFCRSGSYCFEVESLYDTSMALVTFCFGSVFGMVTVRMPFSTLAEI